MKFLFTIVISIAIISCSIKNRKEIPGSDAPLEYVVIEDSVTMIADTINNLIHSATKIYDMAITDYNKGVHKDTIIYRYEKKLTLINLKMSGCIDRLSRKFIADKKNQQEYDEFIQGIEFSSVANKYEELKALGIVFNLKSN